MSPADRSARLEAARRRERANSERAAPTASGQMSASEVDKSPIVERLARMAGLREFEALEFRRKNGESMTEPELHAWRRIEHFACLVPTAIATCAPETNTSNSTPGTGPVAAS